MEPVQYHRQAAAEKYRSSKMVPGYKQVAPLKGFKQDLMMLQDNLRDSRTTQIRRKAALRRVNIRPCSICSTGVNCDCEKQGKLRADCPRIEKSIHRVHLH